MSKCNFNYSYDQCYDWLITQNLTYEEIGEIVHMCGNTVKKYINELGIIKPPELTIAKRNATNLKKYGCINPFGNKEIQEKIKNTNLEKYGVSNPLQNPDVLKKVEQTCLEKYGAKSPLQNSEIIKKIKESNLENFGYANPLQSPEIQEKIKKTNLEKYGTEKIGSAEEVLQKRYKTNLQKYGSVSPMQNVKVAEKGRQTIFERYGVNNVGQNEEVKKKIKQKLTQKYGYSTASYAKMPLLARIVFENGDNLKQYINCCKIKTVKFICSCMGVGLSVVINYLHKYDLWYLIDSSASNGELELAEYLDSLGVRHEKSRHVIPPKEIDLYCPEYKLGIEFNGDYWHCDKKVDKNYHIDKCKLAEQNGVRLIQIYEHEWNDERINPILRSLIAIACGKTPQRIYARNCEVRVITNEIAKPFNNANHLQGHRNAQITYGLYYNNELVQLMSFSRHKKYGWEIVRGCPGSNNIVVGGVSKLFKHFIRENNPKQVFSYCDFNKFDGNGYLSLGMKLIGYTGPDKTWLIEGKAVKRNARKYQEYKKRAEAIIWGAGSKKYLWKDTEKINN